MVDTREELRAEDWDEQIAELARHNYELVYDEPDSVTGPWEFYIARTKL